MLLKEEAPTRLIKTFGLPGTAPVMKEVPAWQAPIHSEKQIGLFRVAPAPSLPNPVPVNIPGEPKAAVQLAPVDFSTAGKQVTKDAATLRLLENEAKAIAEAKKAQDMSKLDDIRKAGGIQNYVFDNLHKAGEVKALKDSGHISQAEFDRKLSELNKSSGLNIKEKKPFGETAVGKIIVEGAKAIPVVGDSVSKIIAGKSSGPVSNLTQPPASSGPLSTTANTSSSLPSWAIPAAIIAAVLLFGGKSIKKLLGL